MFNQIFSINFLVNVLPGTLCVEQSFTCIWGSTLGKLPHCTCRVWMQIVIVFCNLEMWNVSCIVPHIVPQIVREFSYCFRIRFIPAGAAQKYVGGMVGFPPMKPWVRFTNLEQCKALGKNLSTITWSLIKDLCRFLLWSIHSTTNWKK